MSIAVRAESATHDVSRTVPPVKTEANHRPEPDVDDTDVGAARGGRITANDNGHD